MIDNAASALSRPQSFINLSVTNVSFWHHCQRLQLLIVICKSTYTAQSECVKHFHATVDSPQQNRDKCGQVLAFGVGWVLSLICLFNFLYEISSVRFHMV